MCWSVSYHWDKTPEKIHLKRGNAYTDPRFQKSQPMATWPRFIWTRGRQYIRQHSHIVGAESLGALQPVTGQAVATELPVLKPQASEPQNVSMFVDRAFE